MAVTVLIVVCYPMPTSNVKSSGMPQSSCKVFDQIKYFSTPKFGICRFLTIL